MEKEQFNNENFILYSPDSLKYITDNMFSILNDAISFYKDKFNVGKYL